MVRARRSTRAAGGVIVPGIYASLRPWAEVEHAGSGDPRCRFHHDDGYGDVCHGGYGCEHVMPPSSDPDAPTKLMLGALAAGEPVVVSAHTARGHRWTGTAWSAQVFDLPWGKTVTRVQITSDDRVTPV